MVLIPHVQNRAAPVPSSVNAHVPIPDPPMVVLSVLDKQNKQEIATPILVQQPHHQQHRHQQQRHEQHQSQHHRQHSQLVSSWYNIQPPLT